MNFNELRKLKSKYAQATKSSKVTEENNLRVANEAEEQKVTVSAFNPRIKEFKADVDLNNGNIINDEDAIINDEDAIINDEDAITTNKFNIMKNMLKKLATEVSAGANFEAGKEIPSIDIKA